MIETKDRAKLGKRGAYGLIEIRIPLADPEAWGNCGLQGCDEERVHRSFPNAAMARGWVEKKKFAEGIEVDYAKVTTFEYRDNQFEDREYGLILDAEMVEETIQYGYPSENGWVWDEPENV